MKRMCLIVFKASRKSSQRVRGWRGDKQELAWQTIKQYSRGKELRDARVQAVKNLGMLRSRMYLEWPVQCFPNLFLPSCTP